MTGHGDAAAARHWEYPDGWISWVDGPPSSLLGHRRVDCGEWLLLRDLLSDFHASSRVGLMQTRHNDCKTWIGVWADQLSRQACSNPTTVQS